MTPALAAGIAALAIALSGNSQQSSEQAAPVAASEAGDRVAADSYTPPADVMRCIAANINRKMPDLQVRARPAASPEESGFLILTRADASPAVFGVIRVDSNEEGSRLTTWLAKRDLSATPEEVARRLVAGC